MKSTQQLEQTPSIYKDKYSQWVNKYFSQDKAKCVSKNSALFVCIEKSCHLKQPFICSTRSCSCIKQHKKCTNIISFDYFLSVFIKDKPHIQVISEKLQEAIDDLIDKLSQIKQMFLRQLSKGKANHLFEDDKQKQDPERDELLKSEFITGSRIAKLFSSANQGYKEKKQLMVLDQIVGNLKLLENNGIDMLTQKCKNLFFNKKTEEKFCWDKNLSNSYTLQKTNQRLVSANYNDEYVRLAVMSPALTSVKGRFVRWRLKITELSGIIFRDNQRSNYSQFSSNDQIKNCYLIDQAGKTYAYNSPQQDKKPGLGISFQKDDVIEIELDKIDWVLKFKNSRFSPTSSIAITQIPVIKSQSYHICVGFSYKNAKAVEIISTIETPYRDYQIGVST